MRDAIKLLFWGLMVALAIPQGGVWAQDVSPKKATAEYRGVVFKPDGIDHFRDLKMVEDFHVQTIERVGLDTVLNAASAGDADAQVLIATALRLGTLGFEKDREQALMWAEKACAQQNQLACTLELSNRYSVFPEERNQTKTQIVKLCDQGNPSSCDYLARLINFDLHNSTDDKSREFKQELKAVNEKGCAWGSTTGCSQTAGYAYKNPRWTSTPERINEMLLNFAKACDYGSELDCLNAFHIKETWGPNPQTPIDKWDVPGLVDSAPDFFWYADAPWQFIPESNVPDGYFKRLSDIFFGDSKTGLPDRRDELINAASKKNSRAKNVLSILRKLRRASGETENWTSTEVALALEYCAKTLEDCINKAQFWFVDEAHHSTDQVTIAVLDKYCQNNSLLACETAALKRVLISLPSKDDRIVYDRLMELCDAEQTHHLACRYAGDAAHRLAKETQDNALFVEALRLQTRPCRSFKHETACEMIDENPFSFENLYKAYKSKDTGKLILAAELGAPLSGEIGHQMTLYSVGILSEIIAEGDEQFLTLLADHLDFGAFSEGKARSLWKAAMPSKYTDEVVETLLSPRHKNEFHLIEPAPEPSRWGTLKEYTLSWEESEARVDMLLRAGLNPEYDGKNILSEEYDRIAKQQEEKLAYIVETNERTLKRYEQQVKADADMEAFEARRKQLSEQYRRDEMNRLFSDINRSLNSYGMKSPQQIDYEKLQQRNRAIANSVRAKASASRSSRSRTAASSSRSASFGTTRSRSSGSEPNSGNYTYSPAYYLYCGYFQTNWQSVSWIGRPVTYSDFRTEPGNPNAGAYIDRFRPIMTRLVDERVDQIEKQGGQDVWCDFDDVWSLDVETDKASRARERGGSAMTDAVLDAAWRYQDQRLKNLLAQRDREIAEGNSKPLIVETVGSSWR